MCNKCLYCYGPLKAGETDYHSSCARKFFGKTQAPVMPYSRDNISELALQVIQNNMTITGVQPKLSLDINRGGRNEQDKLTIVGLWGSYILKPQSDTYNCLPELEDVTMKMALAAGISTVDHSLIRMADGGLAYITRRIDRGRDGEKYSMLDMCQLSNRLTEHKYRGSYQQLADTVMKFSSAPVLDVQRFWEIVVFSWITGNSDMHCKNFSLIDRKDGLGYVLSPAYDLLAVLLTGIEDKDELALSLSGPGVFDGQCIAGFDRASFVTAMTGSGIGENYANRIIDRLVSKESIWFTIIDDSFLSEQLKAQYKRLITSRLSVLTR